MNQSKFTPKVYGCIYDSNPTGFPQVYIVQERMDGELKDKRFLAYFKTLSRSKLINLISQPDQGLFDLYNKGYVHNDIKPLNMMYKEIEI